MVIQREKRFEVYGNKDLASVLRGWDKLASVKEALVVCSDNNLTTGITIWDISTGEELFHRPTCASPRQGLVCLGHQFLIAAQVQKPGSYSGGAIFIWALNKVQSVDDIKINKGGTMANRASLVIVALLAFIRILSSIGVDLSCAWDY
eukprot:Gb_28841 [translate_table: standard]